MKRDSLGLKALLIGVLFCCSVLATPLQKIQLKIHKTIFSIELARTPQEKERGLMYRTHLPTHSGMLFIFVTSNYYPFWMKNTPSSLDILWLDESFKVVDMVERAEPMSKKILYPAQKSLYVLEFPAGTAKRYNLKIGASIELKLPAE